MAQGGYTFPVMMDPGNLAGRYGVRAVPTHLMVNSEGRVVWTHVGAITAAALSDLVDDLTG